MIVEDEISVVGYCGFFENDPADSLPTANVDSGPKQAGSLACVGDFDVENQFARLVAISPIVDLFHDFVAKIEIPAVNSLLAAID